MKVVFLRDTLLAYFAVRHSLSGININKEVPTQGSRLSNEVVAKISALTGIQAAGSSRSPIIGGGRVIDVRQRLVGFRQPLLQTVLLTISRLLHIINGRLLQDFENMGLFIRLRDVRVCVSQADSLILKPCV